MPLALNIEQLGITGPPGMPMPVHSLVVMYGGLMHPASQALELSAPPESSWALPESSLVTPESEPALEDPLPEELPLEEPLPKELPLEEPLLEELPLEEPPVEIAPPES
jgi:hypothetical protein